MWYKIKAYFKFILKSSNQHGVHSPFVYNLVTKCFYDKKRYSDYKDLKNYTSQLLKNKSTLEVTDLGKGSKIAKTNNRLISELAKNTSSTQKRAQLLYRLANYFNFNNSLELGTSLGISTFALHKGNPEGKITSTESCQNIADFTTQNLKKNNTKNISILNSDISKSLGHLKNETFDFIFLDGNHQKESTLSYFESLLNNITNNSILVFNEIYWSKEMTEAWQIIKNHPKVSVTIDTYWCGFVFFRQEQEKEHFVIRL